MNTATIESWVTTIDQYGKGAWIALMVLSFIVFWPIGLAVLAFLIWSGRMGCSSRKSSKFGAWRNRDRWKAPSQFHSTGNAAFDEYREETLRRLEDEQREFAEFLDSLRKAKDKAEFDQFMTGRTTGSSASSKESSVPSSGTV